MPRFHVPVPLAAGAALALPPGAARHVQVLRLQPGDGITLFNGEGGEWTASVTRMGRSDVDVEIGAHTAVEREAARAVHLVVGMPANERMDWLVEKATELGAASIQPVTTARSVVKLAGERAAKRQPGHRLCIVVQRIKDIRRDAGGTQHGGGHLRLMPAIGMGDHDRGA